MAWCRGIITPDSNFHGANMGSTWADKTHVGPMWAPWKLLSGITCPPYVSPIFGKHIMNKLACNCKSDRMEHVFFILCRYISMEFIDTYIYIYIYNQLSILTCFIFIFTFRIALRLTEVLSYPIYMIRSLSRWKRLRITDPLWGDSFSHRLTRTFDVFFDVGHNKLLKRQWISCWIESSGRSYGVLVLRK